MSVDVPEFAVDVVVVGDDVVIRPNGELDVSTTHVLEACAQSAIETGTADVVFDLGGLTFLDSTGLQAIVAVHRRLATVGRRLRMRDATGPVRRVLELSGVDGLIAIEAGTDPSLA